MQRRVIALVVVCAFMVLGLPRGVFAETKTGPSGTASTTVPSFLEFAMQNVVKMTSGGGQDPWKDGVILATPSFDFGTLSEQKDTGGKFLYMKGQYYYYVLMIATTSGRPYVITETGTGFTGIENAVFMVPDYQEEDLWNESDSTTKQGPMNTSNSVGKACSVVGTSNVVYDAKDGLARIVRAVIAISGPLVGEKLPFSCKNGHKGSTEVGKRQYFNGNPDVYTPLTTPYWTPITKDTIAKSYSGTITFTLTI